MANLKKLILALAILCISSIFYSCDNSSNNALDRIDLIPVKLSKDGNWSMIDCKGNIVYDGEFKNEPSVAYNGYFSVEEGDGYTLYKVDGNKPVAVEGMEGVLQIGNMEEGLIPVVKKNSRIQLVNGNGETKFTLDPIKDAEIVECSAGFSDGLLRFKTEDYKYGYYGTKGKVAIEPKYNTAFGFADNLAVVGKEYNDSTVYRIDYEVINKKGETVFKIKEGYNLETYRYNEGYLIASHDDRFVLIDKKGEIMKLPAKIKEIVNFNSKYIIFKNEDNLCGVADINGEILIRPKYQKISFNKKDSFFAMKVGSDEGMLCLNSKGEEEGKTLDYDFIINLDKFGYLAQEGSTFVFLDKEFKQKGKEEFFEYYLNLQHFITLTSDYFNPSAVAKSMVSLYSGDKVGKYILNGTAQENLKDKEPSTLTYITNTSLSELDKIGFRYKINATGKFSETIASYDYSSSTYNWNGDSKLAWVNLEVVAESDWGEEGQKVMVDALKEKGFKIIKEGFIEDIKSYIAVAKKGNIYALTAAPQDEKTGQLLFATDKIPEVVEYFINPLLKQIGGAEEKIPEVSAPTVSTDSVATDTVRVAKK